MSPDMFGNLLVQFSLLCGVEFLVLFAISLVWIYRDAESQGKTGCLWLLIAFFTWPFGLLAYVLLRDKKVQL
jgi:hypothetical protein